MGKIEMPGSHATPASKEFALWNLGFRPFYLLASLFAALSIVLWIFQYSGRLPAAYLRSAAWHGHEMLFGYTLAVVAGFLLTAVAQLDRQADAERCRACRAGRAVGGRPRAGAHALRRSRCGRQRRISRCARDRHRQAPGAGWKPAQLFLPRAAPCARPCGARVPPLAPGPAGLARAGEPAGRPRHRSLHHGGDRRPRDPDVHQQRRSGDKRDAQPAGRKVRAHRRARAGGRGLAARSGIGGRGARAARCARARRAPLPVATVAYAPHIPWSGCCTSPTRGWSPTSCCADWRKPASRARSSPSTR